MLTQQHVIKWLHAAADTFKKKRDYLTELDAAIGDADHGINMDRGFKKVIEQLPLVDSQDLGSILKKVSLALISSVGGASGPLYGTFFLKASAPALDKHELSPQEMCVVFKQGVDGVAQRGKAKLGDKTMLDALLPAVEAMGAAVLMNSDTLMAFKRATAAAEQGMRNTISMIAKKGRASYLGPRSVDHQDPGATSSYFLFVTLLEVLESDVST